MESTDASEGGREREKSFFGRGALLGLIGGALVAVILMGVIGSVASLIDDVFGSGTPAAADQQQVPLDPLVARGKDLASLNGCVACHTTNGVDTTGPSWKGLSETRTAEYIRQSIVDPNADIVPGFPADVMPKTFGDTLSQDDLDALVAYILSL
jgi:mono/diheme cytochrome c family protein